jgi:hypothetical protein
MLKKFELEINVPHNYAFTLRSIHYTDTEFTVITDLVRSYGTHKEGLTRVSINIERDVPEKYASLPVHYYVIEPTLEEGQLLEDWMVGLPATFIWPGESVIPRTSTCLLAEPGLAETATTSAARGAVTMEEVRGDGFFSSRVRSGDGADTAATARPFV